MKQLLAITLLFASCTTTPKKPAKESRTVVVYPFSADRNDWRIGAAWKITIDSVGIDSSGKVKRNDFTYYRVAVSYKLFDSLGKPRLDSIGRQVDTLQWVDMAEKSIIADYKKDWQEFLPKQQIPVK